MHFDVRDIKKSRCLYEITLERPFNRAHYRCVKLTNKNYGRSTRSIQQYCIRHDAPMNTCCKRIVGHIQGMKPNRSYTFYAYVQMKDGVYYLIGAHTIMIPNRIVKKEKHTTYEEDIPPYMLKYIHQYVRFYCDGIGVEIPYYMTPKGTTAYGGKSTPRQIKAFLREYSEPACYPAFAEANKQYTGVDCSGFTAYVLNESTRGSLHEAFEQVDYKNGINAYTQTDLEHGKRISKAKHMVPGATIRMGEGTHIVLIYGVVRKRGRVVKLYYAHSNSDITGIGGPHKGCILIGNENKDLASDEQTWVDRAYTDEKAKKLYNYTMLLDCVKGKVN